MAQPSHPRLSQLSPLPPFFYFDKIFILVSAHMGFSNASMGDDSQTFLAVYTAAAFYILLKRYNIAYLRVQFLLFCEKN